MTGQTLRPLDVLLVRHAEPVAVGTPGTADDERPLTVAGSAAAVELAQELDDYHDHRRLLALRMPAPSGRSRPSPNGGASSAALADLRERRLSPTRCPTGARTLEHAWSDADFALPGGETGRSAQRRAVAILDLVRSRHPDGGQAGARQPRQPHQPDPPGARARRRLRLPQAMPNPAVYRLATMACAGGCGRARLRPVEEPAEAPQTSRATTSSSVSRRRHSRSWPPSITACAGRSRPL